MSETIIEIHDLTRRFGSTAALDAVSLTVSMGTVMGLVGQNGAGKTTLIKHILGLFKARSGTVRVFGLDPVAQPEKVLSRIGYLSEEGDLPMWMRVEELMRYTASFYPSWDEGYARQLLAEFELDPAAKLNALSKGQRSRAGLLAAMAYRPDLLVLDEPSSGLDPIVRRDILGAIVRTIADDGRTVLFSSHLLSEVERVADEIAMLREGRMIFTDALDAVKQRHQRITIRFDEGRGAAPEIPGCIAWEGSGKEWSATCVGDPADLEEAARSVGGRIIERAPVSLDDIFMAQVRA